MDIPLIPEQAMHRITKQINSREWWRTAINKKALDTRGIFLASSFREAEFYGRPLDNPFKVNITSPLFGDEAYIMARLSLNMPTIDISTTDLLKMEEKKMHIAIHEGFDCIAITTPNQFRRLKQTGHLPYSYELQVFQEASYMQLDLYPERHVQIKNLLTST